eukprot:NODE_1890_length_1766_cov_42.093122_g1607_i0.p1 GENE.NODE_1890_length_1766_cov_42.093122_g1607_i0~~NODE_1890_length_1766_cov_42.093122_g1607_i0.p1  ORF type:complete len:530 (-),score=67.80 NODE_1890_length_1766_cov_42.093122_g1607_i0:123-1712(-)
MYHAVEPKTDCPHVNENTQPLVTKNWKEVDTGCGECGNMSENWICLQCHKVFCGRDVNGHMLEHSIKTKHQCCFSLADLSCWCYSCEAYIVSTVVTREYNTLSSSKFPIKQRQSPLNDSSEDKGGHVNPKLNCPHVNSSVSPLPIQRAVELFKTPCLECGDSSENWICLKCHGVYCARYIQGHMIQHNTTTRHPCVLSYGDLNTWCYDCDSYILSPALKSAHEAIYLAKFETLPSSNIGIITAPGFGGPVLGEQEREEDLPILVKKAEELANLIRRSRHIVFFTGAGISTSAKIPDFRGPQGVWTLQAKGETSSCNLELEQASPTPCHMAILSLMKHLESNNRTCYVVSQNIDGLHRRSGIPAGNISELHGNSFIEICWKCGKDYLRTYDAALRSGKGGRNCEECLARVPCHCHCTSNTCSCGGVLKDSIIHFGEDLPREALNKAQVHCKAADLCIVLGSSLVVAPANQLPRDTALNGGKLVIVNLQHTLLDGMADLRIFGKTDQLMQLVMEYLKIPIPEFDPMSFTLS